MQVQTSDYGFEIKAEASANFKEIVKIRKASKVGQNLISRYRVALR